MNLIIVINQFTNIITFNIPINDQLIKSTW